MHACMYVCMCQHICMAPAPSGCVHVPAPPHSPRCVACLDAARRLLAAGYTHLSERDAWQIAPGGKYFFTRNMSTIVAFAVGEKFKPGALHVAGQHAHGQEAPPLGRGRGQHGHAMA